MSGSSGWNRFLADVRNRTNNRGEKPISEQQDVHYATYVVDVNSTVTVFASESSPWELVSAYCVLHPGLPLTWVNWYSLVSDIPASLDRPRRAVIRLCEMPKNMGMMSNMTYPTSRFVVT